MRRQSSLSFPILLACALVGCASVPAGGQGPTPEQVAALAPGATTQSQVRERLGVPVRTSRLDRQQREAWDYRMYNDPMDERWLSVQFSPDGLVREVLVLKDYTREPCGP